MTHAFLLQSCIERNGQVIQEERAGYTPRPMNYWVEKFYENAVCGWENVLIILMVGLNAEDLFIQYVISRIDKAGYM